MATIEGVRKKLDEINDRYGKDLELYNGADVTLAFSRYGWKIVPGSFWNSSHLDKGKSGAIFEKKIDNGYCLQRTSSISIAAKKAECCIDELPGNVLEAIDNALDELEVAMNEIDDKYLMGAESHG